MIVRRLIQDFVDELLLLDAAGESVPVVSRPATEFRGEPLLGPKKNRKDRRADRAQSRRRTRAR
jgi:hypothetical protein